jgi:RNA polymerase sigma-70 factor (ECF subfamily)
VAGLIPERCRILKFVFSTHFARLEPGYPVIWRVLRNIIARSGVYWTRGGAVIGWATGGDRSGEFEEVALAHLDSLYRSALRFTHNRAEAEDLVQEAYLRALRSFHRFNPGTNCRAWLFTIMRNLFLNRLRRAGREVLEDDSSAWGSVLDSGSALALPSSSPEEEFLQTVLHGDVDRALRALPLVFREAVILVDLEGLSYKEVAQVLGCPMGTVMSRLSRGRHLLRQALQRFASEHRYVEEPG